MKFSIGLILSLFMTLGVHASSPEYDSNPFTFSIQDSIHGWWECFFTAELNGDSLMDFTYRSRTALYAYDHDGQLMWSAGILYPGDAINNHCTKHGAADVDGDGQTEIIALNSTNQIIIFNGSSGVPEDSLTVSVGPNQTAGHVAIVNLRGEGDHDVIVQTIDVALEGSGIEYYLNRSLIAYRIDTHAELWRVEQDSDTTNGLYEGYWGTAHGPFMAADVDLDGKDEVVGGNLVDDDGTVVDLAYPRGWLSYAIGDGYMDHLDAINVGDFRPDLPGLEWIVIEEDHATGVTMENQWNTTMLSVSGILWRNEATFFSSEVTREPQNAATGNFSSAYPSSEVWLSSRGLSDDLNHQHPWVFDSGGTLRADYSMLERLPAGFNDHINGNSEGIEPIVTVDWFGLPTDQIAGVTRHMDGNIGVFDAMTGSAYWSTTGSLPAMRAAMLYAADVAGDSREEIIVYDATDQKVKIFWNSAANPNQPKPSKWDDPLYRRLKQNWNYYQPGSYTYGDYPLISEFRIESITTDQAAVSWTTDTASDSQVEFGETDAYGGGTERNPALITSHSVVLAGLDAYTDIHIRVRSTDTYGKLGFSKDTTFNTKPTNQSLPVQMASLSASTSREQGVIVTWRVESEVNCAGFHVWRSESKDSNYSKLTKNLIPGRGNSSSAHEYGYTDRNVKKGILYWYKIEEVATVEESKFFGPISIDGVSIIPTEFALSRNYPNPFNPETTIEYRLPDAGQVRVVVFNMMGQEVRRLVDGQKPVGFYEVVWDGKNEQGNQLGSGVYFVRMEAGSFSTMRKVLLVK